MANTGGDADADVKIRMEALGTEEAAADIGKVNQQIIDQAKAREAEARAQKAEADAEAAQVKNKQALAKAAEAAAAALEKQRKATEALSKVTITDNAQPKIRTPEESAAASAENQRWREERTAGKTYGLASDPRQMAQEEAAARKAATAALREQEQAEQDLVDAQYAEEQAAQRLKDVQEARARVAKKGLAEEKTGFDALTRAAQSFLAVTFLTQIQQSLGKMRELTGGTGELADALEATSQTVDMFSSGLQTFIMTGNPALAVFNLLITGVSGVGKAYKEMQAQFDATAKSQAGMQDWLVDSATYHADLARSVRADKLAAAFKEEADAISVIENNLRRLIQVEEARASLKLTQAKVAGASKGEQAVIGVEDQAAAQKREEDAAAERYKLLQQQQNTQQGIVKNLESNPNANLAELEKEKQKLEELNKQTAEMLADIMATTEANQLKLTEAGVNANNTITEEGASKIESFKTKFTEANDKNAQQVLDFIETQERELGGKNSGNFKRGAELVKKVMADGSLDPSEAADFTAGIAALKASKEANSKAIQDWLNSEGDAVKANTEQIIKNQTQQAAKSAALLARLRAVEDTLSGIKLRPPNSQ